MPTPPYTLADLPTPPLGKTGWPWTIAAPPLPPSPPDANHWPRISIVTPSFNQADYLEETLRSVLLQGYPNLQTLIIDGASADATRDILARYEPFLDYVVSERDRGQSHALNKGLARADGDLIGWQNSDDFYATGALRQAAESWLAMGKPDVLFGQCHLVDSDSHITGSYPTTPFDMHRMFPYANMFNQSMFIAASRLLEDAYPIDEDFHHCMDYELFWRLILKGCRFEYVPQIDAFFRLHSQAKGSTQNDVAAREFFAIYQMLHRRPDLPDSARQRALASMRGLCIDHFGKQRWELFHEQVSQLKHSSGWISLGPRVMMRHLLTLLGDATTDRLLALRRKAPLK